MSNCDKGIVMNAVSTCPEAETLRQYLLGTLTDALAQSTRGHVTTCLACSHRIDELRLHDPLLNYQHHSHSLSHYGNAANAESSCDRRGGSTVTESYAPGSPIHTLVQEDAQPYDPAIYDRAGLLPPQNSDEIGVLGKYRVLKVLGAGGMGTVYLAQDTDLNRHVALKCMKPVIARFEDARKRFLREARAIASFQHDHIVPIYHVGEENGIPYLAMPLLLGNSLDQQLVGHSDPLPVAEVVRIGREIAEGLAAAHAHGLIHRDIKPANIWLEESNIPGAPGRVKILDFGLARSLHEHSHLTRSGVIVGTPAYMSPEQARGTEIDTRSDLFSLGIVLYRLAVGRLPFDGPSVMAVLSALAIEKPESVQALNPAVPTPLADLIEQLLAKKAADRPATAQQVVVTLQQIYRQATTDHITPLPALPVPAQPAGSWLPLVSGVAAAVLAIVLLIAGREQPTVPRRAHEATDPALAGKEKSLVEKPQEILTLFGDHLQQNGGRIQEIEVSPDGKRVASYAAHDRFVRIWAAEDRRLIAEIDMAGASVCSLVFSRDAKLLAIGTSHDMRLFAINQPAQPRVTAAFNGPVRTIRFSADGRLLAAADDHSELSLWDVDSDTELRRWHFAGPVASLAITSDGRYLATGLGNGSTQLLQVPRRNAP